MNAKAAIGLLAVVLVGGGLVWYFSSGVPSGTGELGDSNQEEETEAGTGTFADLAMRAGSWKCMVKTDVDNAPSEGMAYISGGKIRTDFTSTTNGKTVASSMIQTDGFIYTWSDQMPQGMKMQIPAGGQTSGNTSSGGVNNDSRVDYDCSMWMADDSKFAPPADVTFIELGASGMPTGMPGGYPMPN